VLLDAGIPVRVLSDHLPLLRRARRQVLPRLPPGATLPTAEELGGELAALTLEHRAVGTLVAEVAATYEGLLATRGMVDFDRLMVRALERLRQDAGLRRRWQGRYEHVLVDEFQDVDAAQLDLVATLAEPERNLFVVDDQTTSVSSVAPPWPLVGAQRQM